MVETVWNEGTSGHIAGSACSAGEAKPEWQHDTSCAHRTVADIAAVAAGLAIYDTYQRVGWFPEGGTARHLRSLLVPMHSVETRTVRAISTRNPVSSLT